MLKGRRVTVLGGGVGGLTAARALALRGAEVRVIEQAEAIREVGAGLQISPNAGRVLAALGLGDALAATGDPAEAVALYDGIGGTRVARLPLAARGDGPGDSYRFLHRADLIELLATGARAAGVTIELDRRVDLVRLGAFPPRLVFAGGTEEEAPILIGADGLHSKLRHALNGTVAPFFTHHVAWRAVIPAEAPIPAEARVYMGPGRHLVTYPLRGGRLRNIVAVEERRRWVEESWTLHDDPLALRLAFSAFAPEVRGWLEQVERPWLWGLFRHPVARNWVRAGHEDAAGTAGLEWGTAILGDACHPTLPFLAQGAAMAIEDAWVLANAIDRHDSLAAGLAAYQAAREARVRRIVEAANRNARAYHLAGLPRFVGHWGLRLASALAPQTLIDRFDWLYGHDVTAPDSTAHGAAAAADR